MGASFYLYLIHASKYARLIRPLLRRYYGSVNRYEIIRHEQNLAKSINLLSSVRQGRLAQFLMPKMEKDEVLPFEQYFDKNRTSEIYGDQKQQDELYEEIKTLLSKHDLMKKNYDHFGTYFMRLDTQMGSVDSYEAFGNRIKICNQWQVENYIRYTELAQLAAKGANTDLAKFYSEAQETTDQFKEVLDFMQKSKKETLLYYKVAG